MWQAVVVAVLASAGNNIGKVLQKQATHSLPRLSLDNKVVKAYLRSSLWVAGLAVDLGGAVLMLQAVAHAPVSVVQPVSGCGMAVMAVFSHVYLKEPMTAHDWWAVSLAAVGTIGVGVTSEAEKQDRNTHKTRATVLGLLTFVVVLGLLLFGCEVWFTRGRGRRRNTRDPPASPQAPGSEVVEEIVTGCQAGACFGLSAGAVKTGFLVADAAAADNRVWLSRLWAFVGVLCGVALSSTGFFCQTRGFKEGRAVVVSTCAAVAAILTAVLVGLVVLGETLPPTFLQRVVLVTSWLLIVSGICLLLSGKKSASRDSSLRSAMPSTRTGSSTFGSIPPPMRRPHGTSPRGMGASAGIGLSPAMMGARSASGLSPHAASSSSVPRKYEP